LYAGLKSKFQIPVIEAFGMTEAMSHCFTNPLYGEQRIGTVGLPDGIEASIIDGHLMIRGVTVCSDDWFDTGDLANQDSKGYYQILGRSRDQINVKGVKLNPASLERQLLEAVAGLSSCVIFGTDRVKCLYVGSCTDKDIVDYLINLGTHCRPSLIKTVNEIPLSPAGKISRSLLDSMY